MKFRSEDVIQVSRNAVKIWVIFTRARPVVPTEGIISRR